MMQQAFFHDKNNGMLLEKQPQKRMENVSFFARDWAKYICMIFTVISLYATQFLALLALLYWPFERYQFRTGEWLLSVTDGGFFLWFFSPDVRLLVMASFLLFFATVVFVSGLFFAGRIRKNYAAVCLGASVAIALTVFNGMQIAQAKTGYAICIFLSLATLFCLWDAYRQY